MEVGGLLESKVISIPSPQISNEIIQSMKHVIALENSSSAGFVTSPHEITFDSVESACGTVSQGTSPTLQSAPVFDLNEEQKKSSYQKWKKWVWKCAVSAVTAIMLAALLYGLDLTWCAITAAVVLMALDFQDAGPYLDKVSYSLLVFFAGMFITVEGFNSTGIPGALWEVTEPHARINNTYGIIVLSLVVIVLSNLASNVPTVLLLGPRIALSAASAHASVRKAWLVLAWTSTIGGNLTLIGSAANLIVSEQAGKSQLLGYKLTFWDHLVFGFPSALVVTVIGLPIIRG